MPECSCLSSIRRRASRREAGKLKSIEYFPRRLLQSDQGAHRADGWCSATFYHNSLIRGTNIALTIVPENTGARWMKLIILFLSIFGCFIAGVNARDLGQWEAVDPAVREWYQALMQPDVPTASCCGEADAYWADEVHVRDGKTYVKITDDRPDEPRGRPHVEIGTEIEIPNHKLKWDRANPTGHGIVFLSRNGYVFCYVQPGGV
jgi:hypothetical protein